MAWPDQVLEEHTVTCLMWVILCLTNAMFPMLDMNQLEILGLMWVLSFSLSGDLHLGTRVLGGV